MPVGQPLTFDASAEIAASGTHTGPPPRRRLELLKRVFDVDIICGRCGAKMHRISHIDDPETIAKILDHLGLPTEPPRKAPARAPPQCELLR
jgi:hypothetical protein